VRGIGSAPKSSGSWSRESSRGRAGRKGLRSSLPPPAGLPAAGRGRAGPRSTSRSNGLPGLLKSPVFSNGFLAGRASVPSKRAGRSERWSSVGRAEAGRGEIGRSEMERSEMERLGVTRSDVDLSGKLGLPGLRPSDRSPKAGREGLKSRRPVAGPVEASRGARLRVSVRSNCAGRAVRSNCAGRAGRSVRAGRSERSGRLNCAGRAEGAGRASRFGLGRSWLRRSWPGTILRGGGVLP